MASTTEHLWVSGATGSWGRAVIAEALSRGWSVTAFARSEGRGVHLQQEFPPIRLVLGDVTHEESVVESIRRYQPTLVIHLAALKRIEAAGFFPYDMLHTNTMGVKHVIRGVVETPSVRGALFLSSDKAYEATTFYGATKLIGEGLWAAAREARDDVDWAIARAGNALGSTGSVLEVWRVAMQRGEPLQLYDPSMTRFVLTLPYGATALCHRVAQYATRKDSRSIFCVGGNHAASIDVLADAFAPEAYPRRITYSTRGYGEKWHEKLDDARPASDKVARLSWQELRRMLWQVGLLPEATIASDPELYKKGRP